MSLLVKANKTTGGKKVLKVDGSEWKAIILHSQYFIEKHIRSFKQTTHDKKSLTYNPCPVVRRNWGAVKTYQRDIFLNKFSPC